MTYLTYHNALQKWGSQYSLRIICKGKNSRTKSSRIFHAPNIENTQVTLIPLAYHMSKNGSHQGFFKYIFTYNKVNTFRLHSLICFAICIQLWNNCHNKHNKHIFYLLKFPHVPMKYIPIFLPWNPSHLSLAMTACLLA